MLVRLDCVRLSIKHPTCDAWRQHRPTVTRWTCSVPEWTTQPVPWQAFVFSTLPPRPALTSRAAETLLFRSVRRHPTRTTSTPAWLQSLASCCTHTNLLWGAGRWKGCIFTKTPHNNKLYTIILQLLSKCRPNLHRSKHILQEMH